MKIYHMGFSHKIRIYCLIPRCYICLSYIMIATFKIYITSSPCSGSACVFVVYYGKKIAYILPKVMYFLCVLLYIYIDKADSYFQIKNIIV